MTLPPIDPTSVPVSELKLRAKALLSEPSLTPTDPVPDGQYRCWLCLRVLESTWSQEEADREFGERFPDADPGGDNVSLCDDCDRIVVRDGR